MATAAAEPGPVRNVAMVMACEAGRDGFLTVSFDEPTPTGGPLFVVGSQEQDAGASSDCESPYAAQSAFYGQTAASSVAAITSQSTPCDVGGSSSMPGFTPGPSYSMSGTGSSPSSASSGTVGVLQTAGSTWVPSGKFGSFNSSTAPSGTGTQSLAPTDGCAGTSFKPQLSSAPQTTPLLLSSRPQYSTAAGSTLSLTVDQACSSTSVYSTPPPRPVASSPSYAVTIPSSTPCVGSAQGLSVTSSTASATVTEPCPSPTLQGLISNQPSSSSTAISTPTSSTQCLSSSTTPSVVRISLAAYTPAPPSTPPSYAPPLEQYDYGHLPAAYGAPSQNAGPYAAPSVTANTLPTASAGSIASASSTAPASLKSSPGTGFSSVVGAPSPYAFSAVAIPQMFDVASAAAKLGIDGAMLSDGEKKRKSTRRLESPSMS